jgi:hypothetical protein
MLSKNVLGIMVIKSCTRAACPASERLYWICGFFLYTPPDFAVNIA